MVGYKRHINPDGSTGGLVENTAFVEKTAHVDYYARVEGYAHVLGTAKIRDRARVSGYAIIYNNVRVADNAVIEGDASVGCKAIIYDNAKIFGSAIIPGDAYIGRNAKIDFKVVSIMGIKYPITVWDKQIKVGCEVHTFQEWLDVDEEMIVRWHGDSSRESLRLVKLLAAERLDLKEEE